MRNPRSGENFAVNSQPKANLRVHLSTIIQVRSCDDRDVVPDDPIGYSGLEWDILYSSGKARQDYIFSIIYPPIAPLKS